MDSFIKIHYTKEPPVMYSRAISVKSKYHDPKKPITYSFLEGTEVQKRHTRAGIQKILDVVPGLKIKEVPFYGNVRISFNSKIGSWSYVGTDIFLIDKNKATMNLGWKESSHRVAVHEWCHALNLVHEHLRGVNWDRPKVYEYFSKIGWGKNEVDNNLFNFQEHAHDSSEIDLNSIMLYSLPCELTLDGKNCGRRNTKLSTKDILRLNTMFPTDDIGEQPAPHLELFKNMFLEKKDLNRLLETQVVTLAIYLGIEATEKDLKKDTIQKVWDKINT